ncbi:hypothetical protein [Clostridium sp. HBUAS56010]|uniref:hypothetical protein n=1 Tax=Clostridium sp. HBUAS56010 TaxID=2571127 RepID=UPI00163D9D58|nr:hypothetical protein [Clostridium sp. HBUAS56010]
MTVSDESVLKEIEKALKDVELAYNRSTNIDCDGILNRAYGRLRTLLNILRANK